VTSTLDGLEVFARANDGHIYRRLHDGSSWGNWRNLSGVDGTKIDARSDLDCSSTGTSVHLVATGLNPIGAFLHTFGTGTIYNPFFQEFPSVHSAPVPTSRSSRPEDQRCSTSRRSTRPACSPSTTT
jgi:hypothetical protein